MPKPVEASQPSVLDHPLLLPAKIVVWPFQFTLAKIGSVVRSILGYLLSIGAFSFAKWQHDWLAWGVIEVFTNGFKGLIWSSWDPSRLEKAFKILENVGGIREFTSSKDGSKLDSMRITYKNVKAAIETNGGQIIQCLPISSQDKNYQVNRVAPTEYADVIIPQENHPLWETFYKETLSNLKMEKASFTLENGSIVHGFIINHWNESDPKRPEPGHCYIRSPSPGVSFAQVKSPMMKMVLCLQADMICFDNPGTWKSEGTPSEGAYYLAGEAMVEKAIHTFDYEPKNITIDGFCGGGLTAAHLYEKFHHLGINLFIQNTPDNLFNVICQQAWPASYLAPYAIDGVQSCDPKIKALVKQNNFDSVEHFNSLEGKPKRGHVTILHTKGDKTVDPNSHERLVSAAAKVAEKVCPIMNTPIGKSKDPHRDEVVDVPETWKLIMKCIIDKAPAKPPVQTPEPAVPEPQAGWWSWVPIIGG